MKARRALLFASILILSTTFLLARPGEAQQDRRPGQNPPAHTPPAPTAPAHNPPRANRGRIPPAPARSGAGRQRQVEHLPTGHVNDTPHVNNDQWFGHEQANDPRFRVARPFAHGRFAHFGPTYRYSITRIDRNLHRFWLPSGYFEVAAWDWPLFADWCWDCGDDFVIYEDPDHVGWYLLYNVHTGVYVHVQYLGT